MRTLAALLLAALVTVAACGSNPRALLVVHYDAGTDAADGAADSPADGSQDANPLLGAPCADDGQCDDQLACTYDSCDPVAHRCLNVPDSTQCQDGVYCDGQEVCVPGHGCEPGPVVSCDDDNGCHTVTCVESTRSCQFTLRDLDQDGDPDARCPPGGDCNDLDPEVSSKHAEVCGNGVDDNCNGQIDEQPCVTPQGGSCATAVALGGAGTYAISTIGDADTFATSCSVSKPAAAQTAVATITVPAGPRVDLEVWVTAPVEVAVALQGTCGSPPSELACGSGPGATSVRARAYAVAPGKYTAVVITQQPTAGVEVQVALLPASAPPTDVSCATATPITPGKPVTVPIVEPLPTGVPTACTPTTGELTYSFQLSAPQDVRVYASTLRGSGTPIVGLRAPRCTQLADEIACGPLSGTSLFGQDLPAGTYVLTVSATSPIDASLDVELSPPTTPSQNQTCASPPVAAFNQTLALDLSNHESAIKDGCLVSGPDAAYDLPLARASDVLLIERLPQSETGGLSLDTPACDAATQLGCSTGGTPIRLSKRNVRAGDWRVVAADQLGLQGTLDVLVRDTVAPTIVPPGGAASCAAAIDGSAGGFFAGDTTTAPVTYTSPCDAPTGGEHVQVVSLTLAQPQRVVLDMEGSAYQTLLDVRQGPSCPGTPVDSACYVSFDAYRSFLDLELGAGQYWVLVSGYDGAAGQWDLDVRVLPP